MFKKITNLLLSMQFMTFLLLLFAAVIGYATFIENDFGRSAAKALIFNKWWFELILLLEIKITSSHSLIVVQVLWFSDYSCLHELLRMYHPI